MCASKYFYQWDTIDNATWYEYRVPQYPLANYYQYPYSGTFRATFYTYGALPSASTRFAIVGSLPSTLTLTSEAPLTTNYGMPLLYVYDKTGTVTTTATATSVDSSGTQAISPFPSALSQNAYSLALVNQTNSGVGYSPAGTNLLTIASSQTIAGNPFGVGAQFISTTWQSSDTDDPYGDGTCAGERVLNSGTYSNPFPVVTQYSLNQVNNGGTTIPVGANPTAIALYDSQYSPDYEQYGPCHSYETATTQMARAIVANSGSNTVSILDIVNNVVLSTITVGNQPVALAVTSDGSTAYVANYGGSTVTKVNLTTNTTVTTIAVGGQPTSVALTAAGVLWVGGGGFLTEINTQTMSVIATESTSGRTIAGLGLSDAENELIATTTLGTGNVSIDEISPSSVQTGGPYATVASHSVSTLGTFFNPRIQAQSFVFTSNLTSSVIPINTAQAGAPPLVVQEDGPLLRRLRQGLRLPMPQATSCWFPRRRRRPLRQLQLKKTSMSLISRCRIRIRC